jgi:hypothetical protein
VDQATTLGFIAHGKQPGYLAMALVPFGVALVIIMFSLLAVAALPVWILHRAVTCYACACDDDHNHAL